MTITPQFPLRAFLAALTLVVLPGLSSAQVFNRIYNAADNFMPYTAGAIVDQFGSSVGQYDDNGANPSLGGGLLTTGPTGYLGLSNTSVWDGASVLGSTFEFSLQATVASPAEGGPGYSAGIVLGDNAGYWDTRIVYGTSGAVVSYSGGIVQSFTLDTTVLNTFRITIADGTGFMYVNNNPTPVFTLQKIGGAFNAQQIGNYSGAIEGGYADWEYIRWTNEGAVAPVPEPSVMAALALTGVLAVAFRRRVRP